MKIIMYRIVPKDFSRDIASLTHIKNPMSMFIKFVVINDVVINRQNW